jgi:hypothetical protein
LSLDDFRWRVISTLGGLPRWELVRGGKLMAVVWYSRHEGHWIAIAGDVNWPEQLAAGTLRHCSSVIEYIWDLERRVA